VREFQIVQKTQQHVNVQLVVEPTYNESTTNQIIEWNFRRTFGEDFEVAVSVVPTIARTKVGKYNPIRSMVQPFPPR
jgi:hypothetical protein